MADILMPKATAVWLVENTTLTFEQIAEFCGLHRLEVQAIADDEVATGIVGLSPVANGQLTREEIERCEKDTEARLTLKTRDLPRPAVRSKGPRYTPVAKREHKPAAIAWLLKHHPEVSDPEICKLIGTTKPTIKRIRERTHADINQIQPQSPANLGLCLQREQDALITKAREREGLEPLAPPPLPESEESERKADTDPFNLGGDLRFEN